MATRHLVASLVLVGLVALVIPISLATPSAADSIPSIGMTLWDTKDYNGRGFWGTAFFFQANTENNPSYDWYLVAAKHNRADGGGDMDYFWTSLYVKDNAGKEVVHVDAKPVYHTPWTGSGSFSVGTTPGASVTIYVESNGYDEGRLRKLSTSIGTFEWFHDFTNADKWYWVYKDAAYMAKTIEVNGVSNSIQGYFSVAYQYSVWDWGCWCAREYFAEANYLHGKTVNFQDSTPGK